MCLAIPGRIVKISGEDAVVDYGAERREAKMISKDFKIGDYVIVQARTVMLKVPAEQAREALKLIKDGC